MKLMMGSQSAAQRHIFFAERQAAKIDGLPRDIKLRDVKTVGIIGAGTMGGGIMMNFLAKGFACTIAETQQDALDRGLGIVRKNYAPRAAQGRSTPHPPHPPPRHIPPPPQPPAPPPPPPTPPT